MLAHPLRRTAAAAIRGSTRAHSHDAHAAASPFQHEGFNKGYYVSIAAVIGVIALYRLDVNGSVEGQTFLQRKIAQYTTSSDFWEARTSLHTQMAEQAAADRMLFHDSEHRSTITIKGIESFNNGSPWNVETGWGNGDVSTVRAQLEKERAKHMARFAKD